MEDNKKTFSLLFVELIIVFFVSFWICSLCLKQISCFFCFSSNYLSINPDDPQYINSWHLPKIETDKAWEISTGSDCVGVGIIDSGIDNTITDLSCNLDTTLSHDFFGFRNTPFVDNHNIMHGTRVASIVGAKGNNTTDIAGVSWDSRIIACKVSGETYNLGVSSLSFAAVCNAFDYASYYEIPILNLSVSFEYGVPGYNNSINTSQINSLSDYIYDYTGLIVLAAGNDSKMLPTDIIVLGSIDYELIVSGSITPFQLMLMTGETI